MNHLGPYELDKAPSDAQKTVKIRAALFLYAARNYRPKLVLDECVMWDSQTDVWFLSKNGYGIDCEVKVSMNDLKAETKKSKHNHWGNVQRQIAGTVANYFVFCIPAEMKEKAVPFIAERWPFAGVLVMDKSSNLGVARKMKRIHAHEVSQSRRLQIAEWQSWRYVWMMRRHLVHISRDKKHSHRDAFKAYVD